MACLIRRNGLDDEANLQGVLVDIVESGNTTEASVYPAGSRIRESLPGPLSSQVLALRRAGKVVATTAEFGTCGDLLAALAIHDPIDGRLEAAVSEHLPDDLEAADSLELLEALELSIEARRVSATHTYHGTALALAGELARRGSSGSFFPERLAADRHNLSLLRGISGVAHAFLQAHDPGQIGSTRTLQ